jgi:hypothetical protein
MPNGAVFAIAAKLRMFDVGILRLVASNHAAACADRMDRTVQEFTKAGQR